MMKLGNYLVLLLTMILFLSFLGLNIAGLNPIREAAGITLNETTGELISADIESSNIFSRLFGTVAFTLFGVEFTAGILVALVGTGAVIVGLFAKGYDTSLVILPFVLFVAGLFIATFWSIIKYVATFNQYWMTSIITILFGGLAIGFIMSCVDYFAGR